MLTWLGFLRMGFTFFALLHGEAVIEEPKVIAVVVLSSYRAQKR
jgi:hypothetical protein